MAGLVFIIATLLTLALAILLVARRAAGGRKRLILKLLIVASFFIVLRWSLSALLLTGSLLGVLGLLGAAGLCCAVCREDGFRKRPYGAREG